MTKSIDHYVLMVDDQEGSRETWARLGFNVRPTSRHIEFGSSNAVIIFPDTYLELVHMGTAPPILTDLYNPRLKAGPGLCHVSITADTLALEKARLEAMGYSAGLIMNARRKVILPDGSEDETDSSSMYNWHEPRRYLSLFYSEHRKRDMIFIEGHTHHANGAIDVTRIVSASADPAGDLGYYEDSYGHKAESVDDTGFIMRGGRGDTVEVWTREKVQQVYAPLLDDLDFGGLGGFPVALHYAVSDIETTRACLEGQGVPVMPLGDGLAVPADWAEGAVVVFDPVA